MRPVFQSMQQHETPMAEPSGTTSLMGGPLVAAVLVAGVAAAGVVAVRRRSVEPAWWPKAIPALDADTEELDAAYRAYRPVTLPQ